MENKQVETAETNEEMTVSFTVVSNKTRKRIIEIVDELKALTEFLR